MMTMLHAAGLSVLFWPYAFHYYLLLYNLIPHGVRTESPFQLVTGKVPDYKRLRIFGCRVYALPTRPNGRRPEKLIPDSRKGIFLGFASTLKNVLYLDVETETVKRSAHVIFDEGMNDVLPEALPPYARALRSSEDGTKDYVVVDLEATPFDMAARLHPFGEFESFRFPLDADTHDPGFVFDQCSQLGRAFIEKVHCAPDGQRLRTFRRKYTGSYIVEVNGRPVVHAADVAAELTRLSMSSSPPDFVEIVLAPELRASLKDGVRPPIHLRDVDMMHIEALLHKLHVDGMTDEERALPRLSRKWLQTLSNWDEWDHSFDHQMDQFHEHGTGFNY